MTQNMNSPATVLLEEIASGRGNSLDGVTTPSRAFLSSPLTEASKGANVARSRGFSLRVAGFWIGEFLGAASLFVILFGGLWAGEILGLGEVQK